MKRDPHQNAGTVTARQPITLDVLNESPLQDGETSVTDIHHGVARALGDREPAAGRPAGGVRMNAPLIERLPRMDGATAAGLRDCAGAAAELIHARQTVLPKRLLAPGPDADQLQALLGAASAAPDHGQLLPWRFVIVPRAERASLAEVFAQALRERDPAATPEQIDQAREKAHRAPLLLLLVVDGQCGDPAVNMAERILSAGCAVQNMLLLATAMGYGSALTSGKALGSQALRQRFGLGVGEQALCFMSVGTVAARRPARMRPSVADYCRTLGSAQTSLGS